MLKGGDAYGFCDCDALAHARHEDKFIARLLDDGDGLASGHIGVGWVVQIRVQELEAVVEGR